MGENPRIMNEIADAMRLEEEHRRWAEENSYNATAPTCANCATIQELQRQIDYWKRKYYNTLPVKKEFGPRDFARLRLL